MRAIDARAVSVARAVDGTARRTATGRVMTISNLARRGGDASSSSSRASVARHRIVRRRTRGWCGPIRARATSRESGGGDEEEETAASREGEGGTSRDGAARRRLTIFSVNDVYELENLGRLREFIRAHTNDMRDPFVCTLNGDFLSPSLLSSYDLGAAAVSVMNAVPVTHACLGNHEFDHSTMILGQRLLELDATVLNSNIVSTDEHHGLDEDGNRVGAFVDALPATEILELGGLRVGLLGVCTTSTPLSSAVKPRGVVFKDVVPIVRDIVDEFNDPKDGGAPVDVTIALTHQTLCEDETLAREVPELGLILGGHEHHPYHGALDGTDVLCFKAGMDSENVVMVTLEMDDDDDDDAFEEAASGGWSPGRRRATIAPRAMRAGSPNGNAREDDTAAANGRTTMERQEVKDDFIEDVIRGVGETNIASSSSSSSSRGAGWDVKPGPLSEVRAQCGDVRVTATLHSLAAYDRCPEIDRDIWERSEVLRDLHEYVLPLHEHAERRGLLPLSSFDVRQQQTTLGTLFATILRDECRVDLCLYNSGGVRANKVYDAPLTYGDFVAEVPFENNIITLDMRGEDIYRALSYSESTKTETCSWGGYLLWDDDVDVRPAPNAAHPGDIVVSVGGEPLDVDRVYRVVTWAGLLDGADGIPAFEEVGVRLAESLGVESGSMSSATFSADGVPFKILIMRHLCRWRWGQLRECISFDDMDADADGCLDAADVRDALEKFTASASSEQEADSMVRLFDVDGDGKISKHEWTALLES